MLKRGGPLPRGGSGPWRTGAAPASAPGRPGLARRGPCRPARGPVGSPGARSARSGPGARRPGAAVPACAGA
eukprot:12898418-Alexandrium_andersonii.AAC.1